MVYSYEMKQVGDNLMARELYRLVRQMHKLARKLMNKPRARYLIIPENDVGLKSDKTIDVPMVIEFLADMLGE